MVNISGGGGGAGAITSGRAYHKGCKVAKLMLLDPAASDAEVVPSSLRQRSQEPVKDVCKNDCLEPLDIIKHAIASLLFRV